MNSQSQHADNATIGFVPARELDDFPADADIPCSPVTALTAIIPVLTGI